MLRQRETCSACTLKSAATRTQAPRTLVFCCSALTTSSKTASKDAGGGWSNCPGKICCCFPLVWGESLVSCSKHSMKFFVRPNSGLSIYSRVAHTSHSIILFLMSMVLYFTFTTTKNSSAGSCLIFLPVDLSFQNHWLLAVGLQSHCDCSLQTWWGPLLLAAHVFKFNEAAFLSLRATFVKVNPEDWDAASFVCKDTSSLEADSCVCRSKLASTEAWAKKSLQNTTHLCWLHSQRSFARKPTSSHPGSRSHTRGSVYQHWVRNLGRFLSLSSEWTLQIVDLEDIPILGNQKYAGLRDHLSCW